MCGLETCAIGSDGSSALAPARHATQGCFRRYRSVNAGYFASIAGGRTGRLTKLPLQFGQTPPNTVAAQSAQNVHSKVQIRASGLSGGRSRSQHSQFGFSFITTGPLSFQTRPAAHLYPAADNLTGRTGSSR